MQAVCDKLDEISTTVFDAMDSLENRDLVTDGSQTDPESITMGALRGCENTGTVQADRKCRRHRGRDGHGRRRPRKRCQQESVFDRA